MARLFTAIELGAATRDAVVLQQSAVARALRESGDVGLRLVQPAHLHLTLVFLGEIGDERVPQVVQAMQGEIPVRPFDLTLRGLGVFPPRGPARVLWLGLDAGLDEVTQLFEVVSRRLVPIGIPLEQRPFSPHLTLGRWRDRGPSAHRLRLADAGPVAVERVTTVTLFQSRLQPSGPEHTPLARAPLH